MSPLLSDALLRTQGDARLATLAGHGHERAFGVLVERYRPALVRTAARLAGAARAEDITQQALLNAWRSLKAGTEVRHVRGWLFQILRNTIYSEPAHEHAQLPDEIADPRTTAALAEGEFALAATLAALANLPQQQRLAIAQTELAGRSRREVARDLGLSEGAVRQLLYRARVALRQAVTALTPLQLARWAAQPRAGSRLSNHVAGLTAAKPAGASGAAGAMGTTLTATGGAGAALTGGGGPGAVLLGTATALKGAAAIVAVVAAIGGAVAIEAAKQAPSGRRTRPSPAASAATVARPRAVAAGTAKRTDRRRRPVAGSRNRRGTSRRRRRPSPRRALPAASKPPQPTVPAPPSIPATGYNQTRPGVVRTEGHPGEAPQLSQAESAGHDRERSAETENDRSAKAQDRAGSGTPASSDEAAPTAEPAEPADATETTTTTSTSSSSDG